MSSIMDAEESDSDCLVIDPEDDEDELVSFEGDTSHDDGEAGNARAAAQPRTCPYIVVDADTIGRLQQDVIDRATATLACTDSEARIALRHYRWNLDRLMEAVVEKDRDTVFSAAGAASSGHAEQGEPNVTMCMICMEDLNSDEDKLTMSCGHTFCKDCWLGHFQVIINEGRANNMTCMEFKCGAICSQPKVHKLLQERDPEALAKYEHAIVHSYIEDNAHVKWCPSVPCCERAIEVTDESSYCEPQCHCGKAFCFKCCQQPHSPATCKMWQQWQEKMNDDSETVTYLKAHVKPCPKCNVPVEKNGGCNLVVCRSCRQPFCWLCGAKTGTSHTWERIEGHTCGEWKAQRDKEIADSQARHKRYMHFYNHYQGHLESLQKEQDMSQLTSLISKLDLHVSGTIDWSYLTQAHCTLLECRRILSNAYVFCFFMFEPANFEQDMSLEENQRLQQLFEDAMAMLTTAVESLSHTLQGEVSSLQSRIAKALGAEDGEEGSSDEAPPSYEDDSKCTQSRLDIMNLTVNIDKRIRNLFERIEKDILSTVCSQNVQISPYTPVYKAAPTS